MSFAEDVLNTGVETFEAWRDDHVSRLAASLAYYMLLSLAPLVLLAVFVSGLAFGEDAARGQIARSLSGIVGPQAAVSIQAIIGSAHKGDSGWFASCVGLVVLLFGASSVFVELQDALNIIWSVPPAKRAGFLSYVRQRAVSFLAVISVAVLLLMLTVVTAVLSALGTLNRQVLPGGEMLWQALSFAVSFAIAAGLFALLFKYLPDVHVAWRAAWYGSTVTAGLFVVGKSLLGVYLGTSSFASSYGGAGSVVALVVWVYYSAQILFVGVELTRIRMRQACGTAVAYLSKQIQEG